MRAPGVGVAGIAFDLAGRVLLVRRANPPAKGLWAFPGGRVELGERLEDALRREFREECGIEVRVGERMGIIEAIGRIGREEASEGSAVRGDALASPASAPLSIHHHWVIVQYRVKVSSDVAPVAGDDAAEVRWLQLEEIEALPTVPDLLEIVMETRNRWSGETRETASE